MRSFACRRSLDRIFSLRVAGLVVSFATYSALASAQPPPPPVAPTAPPPPPSVPAAQPSIPSPSTGTSPTTPPVTGATGANGRPTNTTTSRPEAPGAPRNTRTNNGPEQQQQQDNAPPPQSNMMAAVPGGITADEVGKRAAHTSWQAKGAYETAEAAKGRSDAAYAQYFPRIGLTARYTRLSKFTPPSVGSGSIVATLSPPGTVNPPDTIAASFAFPIIVDNYLLQATIQVPISDLFFKINESYRGTLRAEEAARLDVITARAKSFSDGKSAYFTWLRSRGSQEVAEQTLAVAKAHLADSKNQFTVGNASKADVLRAETQVASAELGVERAKNGVIIAERQVRIATHAKPDEKLEPGESIDAPLKAGPNDLNTLLQEAWSNRPEIKSIEKNTASARHLVKAQEYGALPALSAFGDATEGNPNSRRFPQTQDWFGTWQVGAQLTWSPNDILIARGNAADARGRAATLEAQRESVHDNVELEVTQAMQAVSEADIGVGTTTRQLESAEEGYRVARELYNAGRGTGTTLIDAEVALAQARFEHLNARVDARLARIRLDHALGRDVNVPQ